MWSIFLKLAVIELFFVFVIDFEGFIAEMERYLGVFVRSKAPVKIPKPFSCSTCAAFWTGLFYLIISNSLSFTTLLFLIVISISNKLFNRLIYTFIGFFERLFSLFEKLTGIE